MGFSELVAQLRDPGEGGLPETIYDDLVGEYEMVTSGGAERAAALQAEITALQEQIASLKAMNFDLLTASGWSASSEPDEKPDPEPDTQTGIDALFEGTDD